MILSRLRMSVTEGMQEEYLESLLGMLEPVRTLKGCLSFCLYWDIEDANSLILIEEWDNSDNFRGYLHSDYYRIILLLIELSEEPADMRISRVSNVRGIDLVEEVRLGEFQQVAQ